MIKRTLRSKNFRRMSGALLILTLSLTAITPIFAQDTTPPVATPAESAWIGWAILIIGLIAIGIVGLSTINRRSLETAFTSNESDEELIPDTDETLQ